jgi:hypothetical protein
MLHGWPFDVAKPPRLAIISKQTRPLAYRLRMHTAHRRVTYLKPAVQTASTSILTGVTAACTAQAAITISRLSLVDRLAVEWVLEGIKCLSTICFPTYPKQTQHMRLYLADMRPSPAPKSEVLALEEL